MVYNLVENELTNAPGWKVIGYPLYLEYLASEDNGSYSDLYEVISYVDKAQMSIDFKWHIEAATAQFLLGVYPLEKIIRVGSKHLNYELTLLTVEEKSPSTKLDELRDHSIKIAEIPLENTPTVIEYISRTHELPLFNEAEFENVLTKSKELSNVLVDEISKYRQSLFEKVSDYGLTLTANFMLIRIHLLKFLAILSNLDHDKTGHEVKRIFIESLRRLIDDSITAHMKGHKGQKKALPKHLKYSFLMAKKFSEYCPAIVLAWILRNSVRIMATRFIAGESIQKASRSLQGLYKTDRDATIDQLGELVVSTNEADKYTDEVIEIIEGLKQYVPKGSQNAAGINKAHVSIKVSALCHDFKPQDFGYTYSKVAPRLKKILIKGMEEDVFVNIDAEHYHYRDSVFEIYAKLLLETEELKNYKSTGIVVQAYLRDGHKHLQDVMDLAHKRGIRMPIRLVKGAYWDAETVEADAHNYNAPEFLNKEETDLHYRQLVYLTLKNDQLLHLALASHNIQDHCFAEALRESLYPNAPVIEHQCLHMTYEGLSVGLSKMKWPTRNYIPVGNLLVGMAYLVRRIMENSSQVGVLTIMRSHKKNLNFQAPLKVLEKTIENKVYSYDCAVEVLSKDFKNIYPIRTYIPKHLERVKKQLDHDLSALAAGKLFHNSGEKEIPCSSMSETVLGKIHDNTNDEIETKIQNLFVGYQKSNWKEDSLKRFSCLKHLADLMLLERERLTSLIMLEAGKSIEEAIADVDEAIDFIHFYVSEQSKNYDSKEFAAKGIVGVIAPWNFPLAISCGMSVASLCSGNHVIYKPAEQTSLVGLEFIHLCRRAGIGEDIIAIALGEAEAGKYIVNHELVSGIVFTGSKAVGCEIYKKVATSKTSNKYDFESIPKFAITEMGGKNAIIVTNNCELDETVSGVIYSAFAHAGQKCSAASRIIIDNKVKDAFINRFIAAVEDLEVGPATCFATYINPLITEHDQERVLKLSDMANEEVIRLNGTQYLTCKKQEENFCVTPGVFELSQEAVLRNKTVASKEVFGPLVHIVGYDNLDEAIKLFNSTEYALTGGIYCQSQDDINYLMEHMEAGNIYVNRPNTGARVAIEPFGGFKMSGTGPKAGGVDYLEKFNRYIPADQRSVDYLIEDVPMVSNLEAVVSGLSYPRRSEIISKIIALLVNHFESYFGAIGEMDKSKLEDFLAYIDSGEMDLSQREFPNRYIPGQISFGKKDLSLGVGVLVASETHLYIENVLDALISLLLGNGLNVVALNEIIFEKWKKLFELFYAQGISSFNFTLSKLTRNELNLHLGANEYAFIIMPDELHDSDIMEKALDKKYRMQLTKVIKSGGARTWDQAINNFSHTRAYAINTMRHGAPLELTL